MHPAVRAHIDGNLTIIRTCLAQIEVALVADDAGHKTSAQIGAVRAEKENSGAESHYLDPTQENMLTDGIAEIFKDTQEEAATEASPTPQQVVNETISQSPFK